MDSERFDGLVRSFGQTRSRRQTLRGLAGAAAAGAFALGGREVSADVCKREGKACKRTGQCCGELECLASAGGTKNPNASPGSTAGSGKVCTTVGACTAGTREECVVGPSFPACEPSGCVRACFCAPSVEGPSFCGVPVSCGPACTSSTDCNTGAGEACIVFAPSGCCENTNQCVRPCSSICGQSATTSVATGDTVPRLP